MKNKKLLTRLFAVLSSLILVVALAVPCFAAEPEVNPASYITKQITFTDRPSLLSWCQDNFHNISGVSAYIGIDEEFLVFSSWYAYNYDTYQFSYTKFNISTTTNEDFIVDPVLTVFELSNDGLSMIIDVPVVGGENEGLYMVVSDEAWVDVGIMVVVNYIEEFSGSINDTPPTRSGMFGQLYYILRDAIYGENVVIDNTQDFALTLVVTLLVLCTVLLPVLLVVAIMFKLFRW